MTAYDTNAKSGKTVCGALKALRLEMGYSIGEMAQLLGIHKATYQGYETGRRQAPKGLIGRVREWQRRDREFMAGMTGRIDARLEVEGFGAGIPSEVDLEGYEALCAHK